MGGPGRSDEGIDGAEKERVPPWGEVTGHLGKLGGSWGTKEPGGDTYLINWPRSSHRVSQPGHLHSPCPYRGWEPGVSSWEEL